MACRHSPKANAITASAIRPAAASPLIDLNGADNVTIDGLSGGGNSLTISNTTVGATAGTSTIRLIGGATNNTVKRCNIQGSSTGATGVATGNVLISTSTVAGGNSTNTITLNNIGPAGANLPTKGVVGLGTAANPNTGNIIDSNNVFDFFGTGAANTSGINVAANNNTWTISNNRLYQTAPRTFTGASRYVGISIASAGNSFTITGNTIGFGGPTGVGTTTISGGTNTFRGLDITNVSTTVATSIQGNVISGISQTTDNANNTSSTSGAFVGISMASSFNGLFNVGNVTGNRIGSLDGSSTVVVTSTSVAASTIPVFGILNFADHRIARQG